VLYYEALEPWRCTFLIIRRATSFCFSNLMMMMSGSKYKVFVLMKTCAFKEHKIRESSKNQHREMLYNLCSSSDTGAATKLRTMRCVGQVSSIRIIGKHKILVGKCQGKMQYGSNKMCLTKMGREYVSWIQLAQDGGLLRITR
jgi:hypothetical protein